MAQYLFAKPIARPHRFNFDTKPRANPKATVGGTGVNYRFQVLDDGLIRYEYASDGVFEDRASTFAIYREQPVPDFRVIETDHDLQIITDLLHLFYDKQPFSPYGLRVQIKGYVSNSASLWRYGYHHDQHMYALGGTIRTLDKVNGRVSLGTGAIALNGYAEIDDSDSMLFTEDGWISGRTPPSSGPRIDGYLFCYGHSYKQAIKALYRISGSQPVLPRWALGNWWSRNFQYSEDSYLELVDRFRDESIPLSVAVLDMKWHWVEEEMVRKAKASGWTGYSWNTELFPDPKRFLEKMHDRRLKVTCCDHPSEGIAPYEDKYQEVCKAVGQDPDRNETVPFDIADLRYFNAYFDIVLQKLEDDGIDFFWQDWQQGPFSSVRGCDPLWILNHYHYLNMQKDGRRPFIFSRYAGPGSHRYPIGFSGDTIVTWESLAFQPEFTATASNMGFGWWSNDIGGFMNGYRDDELTVRWAQLGLFSPIFRLHSANNIWMSKEPWNFPIAARDAQTAVLRMRHRLIPYLYCMNLRSARDLEPLVQPVYWHYPKRAEAYWNKNTFYFGSELFIVPMTSQRDVVTLRAKTNFWMPPGRHVDIFSGMVYDGDRQTMVHRRLDEVAAFAKEGAIIPLDGNLKPEFGAANPDHIELLVVVGANGYFELHEDDGSGSVLEDIVVATTKIEWNQKDACLTISRPQVNEHLVPRNRRWTVTFVGHDGLGESFDHGVVDVDGKQLHVESSCTPRGLQVIIPSTAGLPGAVEGDSRPAEELVIALPQQNPKLRYNEVGTLMKTRISEAQAEYRVKKIVWATVTASEFNNYGLMIGNTTDHSTSRKVAELSSMALDGNWLGSLLEVLTADHRCEEEDKDDEDGEVNDNEGDALMDVE